MDNNLGQVVLVKDINPTVFVGNTFSFPESSDPGYFVEFNNKLYFAADNGESGNELFVSDGTAAGTQLLVDLDSRPSNFGNSGSFPRYFIEFNDKLYFAADGDGGGSELFVSDGTAAGTQLLADINPDLGGDNLGFGSGSYPNNFIEFNNKLYFTADNGENGTELFVSDGTAEGTKLLVDLNPGAEGSFSNRFLRNFVEFNNKLYFAADNGENGSEIFVSDGTAEGTELLVDLRPGFRSLPRYLTEFNGKLYFAANNGENGRELFVSDGTAAGTQLLVDLRPELINSELGYGSYPSDLTEFNGKLYFSANDGEVGTELFVTDGTAEGTQLVADIRPGTSNYRSSPSNLTVVGDELFFSAFDESVGRELLKLTFDSVDDTPVLITGSDLSDNLIGSDRLENILALSGQDIIDSGGGNDTVDGGDGDDIITSASGNNSLIGGNGNDTIDSGDGNDTIDGGNGDDILTSLGGDDSLTDRKSVV